VSRPEDGEVAQFLSDVRSFSRDQVDLIGDVWGKGAAGLPTETTSDVNLEIAAIVRAATVTGYEGSAQGRTYQSVFAQVGLGRYCFYFVGFTTARASRDSFLKVFPAMLGSFQRGTPASPPF
jgi:hypothetical protein